MRPMRGFKLEKPAWHVRKCAQRERTKNEKTRNSSRRGGVHSLVWRRVHQAPRIDRIGSVHCRGSALFSRTKKEQGKIVSNHLAQGWRCLELRGAGCLLFTCFSEAMNSDQRGRDNPRPSRKRKRDAFRGGGWVLLPCYLPTIPRLARCKTA